MQLNPITIVCPACKVGQLAQELVAEAHLVIGEQSIPAGHPYIICRVRACGHVIFGKQYRDVTAICIKNPEDLRKALLNQLTPQL